MKDHFKENYGLYILFIFIISFLVGAIYCANEQRKYCENKGGHLVSLYKSNLCVKDGLIIE